MIRFNEFCQAKDIDEAWEYWYDMIKPSKGEKTEESRDGAVVGEVINATTVIEDPTRCILKSPIRKLPMRYMVGELLWYLSGQNTLKSIQTITSAWDRMSDDGETVNSNYGWCIKHKFGFNQWEYVRDLLRKDPNTRQAVIHIKTAENSIENPTKDMNCTVALQFFIRSKKAPMHAKRMTDKSQYEPKLYMSVYMRSNDLWMGFPNDVFQFTAMQILMAMELGVGVGAYTHHAGSLHLYERDYEKSLNNIVAMKVKNGEITNSGYPVSVVPCGEDFPVTLNTYEGEPLNDSRE